MARILFLLADDFEDSEFAVPRTSWPSIRRDLENAGAKWVDEPVHVDGNLITSRKPDDLDPFVEAVERALP